MLIHSLEQLIGNTPLMQPDRYSAAQKLKARLLLKLECRNPLGSVKDRVALAMIDEAEQTGRLRPGGVIIEPTGGSAGIGLAFIGALRGYRVIITMPDTAPPDRRALLSALGAEVVLTPGAGGMKQAIARSEQLASEIPNSWLPRQFENAANPDVHRRTTAREIIADIGNAAGTVDIFVAGVGTGGTLTGIGGALKERWPGCQIAAVEPADSPVLSGGRQGTHALSGIGAGFLPPVLDKQLIDTVISVRSADAFAACRKIAAAEGLLLGASSGAALYAATALAKKAANRGKTIVAIMPDTGERYLGDIF
ncbi:MAG: cysteine synthase A [Oscillospiraceae bacterium]|nr:cysteine synthase A [Oscillospiraceae bacterium]